MADLNRIPGAKSLIDRTFSRLRRIALWTAWWPFVTLLGIFLIAVFIGVFENSAAQFAALATLIALINRFERPNRSEAIS